MKVHVIAPHDATKPLNSFRSKDFRDLARKAHKQGWTIVFLGGGHVRCVNPRNHQIVMLSVTATTDGPVLKPKITEFRKAGLEV